MICAVVRVEDGVVVNVIVASPEDPPLSGCQLVSVEDNLPVTQGWTWTEAGGFIDPSPSTPPDPSEEEIEQEAFDMGDE